MDEEASINSDSTSVVPLPAWLEKIAHPQMRDLMIRLVSAHHEGLSHKVLADASDSGISPSTISRMLAGKTAESYTLDFKPSERHTRLLNYLTDRAERAADAPALALAALPGLDLAASPLFAGVRKQLRIRDERLRFMRADFPGDYLMAAFSSSWPGSFTISVLRIGTVGDEVVSSEVQSNRSTGNVETYRGLVYGRSDTRGIMAFEEQQGFVRHYIQRERSPRMGQVRWMKGYLVTTTGDQNGFFSPFFMERLPAGRFQEQDLEDETADRMSTHFAYDNFTHVDTIDEIAKAHRGLVARYSDAIRAPAPADRPSALDYFGTFVRHAESHFLEAEQQIQYSFQRMRPRPDAEMRLTDRFATIVGQT